MTNSFFQSPRQLVHHARDEISDASKLIEDFVGQQRASRVTYQDHLAREDVHRVKLEGPELPLKVANLVKDAAANLRDALDHAVYAAAVYLNGGKPRHTGFPFALDDTGVAGELASKRLADNPQEMRPYLLGLQPYKGGNDLLWSLNQLRNPSTHRFIVPVGTALMSQSLGIGSASITTMKAGYSQWYPDVKEIEFLRLGWGSKIDYQVQISVAVLFEEIEAVKGKPVIDMLQMMAKAVSSVVDGLESEAIRIREARGPAPL